MSGILPRAVYLALALCSLLAACGGGRATSPSATAGAKHSPVVARQVIKVGSPALVAGGIVPRPYTCAQKIWLPLRWGAIPRNTGELVLYMGGFGKTRLLKPGVTLTPITSRIVVLGLKPTLHTLDIGPLPKHALGLTEAGVPMCPHRTSGEKLFFKLYALPRGQRVSLASVNTQSPINILNRVAHDALAIGELTATYGGP
jgi:phosphatidylethanolamine-binding protein (PEBP) family uncharacterized protein